MKVLITGGGGFLGTAICKQLIAKNYEVISISRGHYEHLDKLGIKQFSVDITNIDSIRSVFNKITPTIVIHTAAFAGVWGKEADFYNINYVGTVNITKVMQELNIKYLVYTSSPSVIFGKDSNENSDESIDYPKKYLCHYAKTKALAEKYVRSLEFPLNISIRPHLIYGKNDPHIIPKILELSKQKRLKIIGNGDNLVDITHVKNAAYAHILGMEQLMKNESLSTNTYFVGQERPVKLWSFIDEICKINKISSPTKKVKFNTVYKLGHIFEMIYSVLRITKNPPPMTRFVACQLGKHHYYSHNKAIKDLGYRPLINYEESLKTL